MEICDEVASKEGLLSPATTPDSIPRHVIPPLLESTPLITHLSVFGILGILTRYLLELLFGPGRIFLYLDLPSNILGSFLMGWLGIIFKEDISQISDLLAIGLTTGYLGSLTTFSGWNQNILDLSVTGHWMHAALAVILGLAFAATSIWLGVITANAFKIHFPAKTKFKVDSSRKKMVVFFVLVLILVGLWGLSIALVLVEPHSGGKLWVACIVGPLGVWLRFYLSRFNGEGLGKNNAMKWIPFGTLAANILAATLMAALATAKKVVNTQECDMYVNGVQFGLLGCLSTVSTFMAEFYKLHMSKHKWRAYAYAGITLLPSLILGTLIYSVPVWAKGNHQHIFYLLKDSC